MLTWFGTEPAGFVGAVLALSIVGALLPLDVGSGRDEHIVLTITATAQLGLLGSRGLFLVWAAVGVGLLARRPAQSLLTTGVAITVGFAVAYAVYVAWLGRGFPLRMSSSRDGAVALLVLSAAWMGTMSVRVASRRLAPLQSRTTGTHIGDPFESPLVPYLLPTVGGAPIVAATVALYHPTEPWMALLILAWSVPLYATCRFDLHQRRLGSRLRHDAELRSRLAAIGEMTSRILHQSRHHAGLMGWSIHRLRRLVGDPSPEARRAAEAELDALSLAKQHIQEAFEGGLPSGPPGQREVRPVASVGSTSVGVVSSDEVPVDALVGELVSELARKAEERGIDLDVDDVGVEGGHGATAVVPLALRPALFNLLDNALDAAVAQVTVTTGRDKGAAVVAISDDGPGLPDDQGRAFGPFCTTKPDGTGMGLPIADAIVAELGGDLRYVRRAGRTTFSVSIPPGE